MALPTEKLCTLCKLVKPRSDFRRKAASPDGLRPWCNDCYKIKRGPNYKPTTERKRAIHRKNRYGLGEDEYNAMLQSQDGRCAICGHKPLFKILVVDHCHDTGAVRGLLCHDCNRGLGSFRDNSDICKLAAQYLDNNQPS